MQGTTTQLMLFACSDTLMIFHVGVEGSIEPGDIGDLDGDGVPEFVCRSSVMGLGECETGYAIINFKGGRRNELYQVYASSLLDCGLDDLAARTSEGDTLDTKYNCSLVRQENSRFAVQQIRSVKVHNGGSTDNEIRKSLVVSTDTVLVQLRPVTATR